MAIGRPKKAYKFISPDGDVIETVGLAEFCERNKLSVSHMSAVHCGKNKSHKGWSAFEIKRSSPYGGKTKCGTMTCIPTDAYLIARDGANKLNMPIEEYIADIIEYVAGGYVDSPF